MQVGAYSVSLINTGLFRLDGGAMFGVVPKVLWQKQKPADERNRIFMCAQSLVVRGNGRTIIVDTGIGMHNSPKFCEIYAVDTATHNLPAGLAKLNIAPQDVTDVVLTHLHFDHIGGAVTQADDSSVAPSFPNATYHISAPQLRWAQSPSEKDRASFLDFQLQAITNHNHLKIWEQPGEIFPGIEFFLSDGHTTGMMMLLIHDAVQPLFYAADLVPTSAHVPVPWVMAYDLRPLTTIEEKKHFLARAVNENWMVVFEHDPALPCATIQLTDRGYAIKEKQQI
jgi:glyoxylase-like metal-dependent hydrolase (beta-lactamase superfamily II)